jgi:hypothetical protein
VGLPIRRQQPLPNSANILNLRPIFIFWLAIAEER